MYDSDNLNYKTKYCFANPLAIPNHRDLENDFIIKLNPKKVLKLILKTLKKGKRRFGATLRHYQVKKVIVKTRIYKT